MEEVPTLKMYAIRQCIKTLTDDELKEIRTYTKRLKMKRHGRYLYGPLLAKTLQLGQFTDELSSFDYVTRSFLVDGQRYHFDFWGRRKRGVSVYIGSKKSYYGEARLGWVMHDDGNRGTIHGGGGLRKRVFDFALFLLDTSFGHFVK